MKIVVHIGPDAAISSRLQSVLAAKRGNLGGKGILYPRCTGEAGATRLFMAVTDPEHVDPLRHARALAGPDRQAALRDTLRSELEREIDAATPDMLLLSSENFGSAMHRPSEIARLREFLASFSDDIRIVAHVDAQARALARHYPWQVFAGRDAPLSRDLGLAGGWWDAALATMPDIRPEAGQFEEVQGAPFWLDYTRLVGEWEAVFGTGSVTLRPCPFVVLEGETATDEVRATFGLDVNIGKSAPWERPAPPSAAWLTRARLLNELVLKVLASGKREIPRPLWRNFLSEIAVPGPEIDPGDLASVMASFAAGNAELAARFPELAEAFRIEGSGRDWEEADPEYGYRASQYLLAFMYRIDRATQAARKARRAEDGASGKSALNGLSPGARAILPPLAVEKYEFLKGSSFVPHNRLGRVGEEHPAPPFEPAAPRELAQGSTGRVIVGCMKNEAPYILEWVAYHRAIGVDTFLIYSNGCEDGTDAILARLQEMGVLQHRKNDTWQGNSPQQWALDRALEEPVIRNAEWILHIDVDEFVNVRCGNGTLDDFLARVPDATNVAMTWRLFGHNGVQHLADDFVIAQFDACAPRFCPKPHTVWGFKTMFRNIGAYSKMSCHRPNKLADGFEDRVRWVNGSGQDMTREVAKNGWRNSKRSIGYDLLQLNHYALRSAESFLIKRQRGRALHVDRSIGLNYWIRMDWCDHRDVTIQRNIPRLRAEYDRLLADPILADLHQRGLGWHRAKAEELRADPEFRSLFDEALKVRLTDPERVAYALALDVES